MPYWGWSFGLGWLWMLVMMVVWVLFIVGLVYVIVGLLGRGRRLHAPPAGESALDLLDRRYARGEISREEYLRMRHDLEMHT